MNDTQTLITILIIAAILGGGRCLRMWLSAQSQKKQIAFMIRKNEQETERYRIICDLALQNAQAAAKAMID